MIKCLCDICKENEANKHFKVKRPEYRWRDGYHGTNYVKIDICENCYNKLISLTDKEFTNILNKYINKNK